MHVNRIVDAHNRSKQKTGQWNISRFDCCEQWRVFARLQYVSCWQTNSEWRPRIMLWIVSDTAQITCCSEYLVKLTRTLIDLLADNITSLQINPVWGFSGILVLNYTKCSSDLVAWGVFEMEKALNLNLCYHNRCLIEISILSCAMSFYTYRIPTI